MKRIVMIALLTSLVGAVFAAPPNGRKPLTPAERQQRAAEAAKRKQQFLARVAEKPSAKATVAKVFEKDGKKLLYRFHAPKVLKPGEKYPLVILMHGAGERGNDNLAQLFHGADDLLGYANKIGQEIFFIAGQVPEHQRWVEHPWNQMRHTMDAQPASNLGLLLKLVEKTLAELPVDPSRVYVTGISMGGYGTWEMVQRRPDLFAAAMPICGGGDVACAAKIKDVPIWCFHGDADGAVPVNRSRDMFNAVKALNGKIQYREYPGVGHDCWTRTYKDESVLAWFFAQKKR